MTDDNSNIPESLQKALKAKEVVPFVGAGVSRAVEKKDKDPNKAFNPLFPSWKEYVEILSRTLEGEIKPREAQLVRSLVNIAKPKYPDAMQHAFQELGENVWISQFDTGFDQAELVRNRFRKLSDCLIIFDNVDERKAIENYLPESGARPHVLITSREKQEFFDEINLDVLHRDESRKLLLEVSGRSLEDDANENVSERLLNNFVRILNILM
jgi:hypothetical protein